MDFKATQAAIVDELTKVASELTPESRSHMANKNFAVSAKASNTGKPAYPIPDKAHARAALGFAAMHHDSKDLSEVRKDVEKKFPGMVHEGKKEASEDDARIQLLDSDAARVRAGKNPWLGSAGGLAGAALGLGAAHAIGPARVGHFAYQQGAHPLLAAAGGAVMNAGLGIGGYLAGHQLHKSLSSKSNKEKEAESSFLRDLKSSPEETAAWRAELPETEKHVAWSQENPIKSRLMGAAALGVPGALTGGALGSALGLGGGKGALIGGGLGALGGGIMGSAARKQTMLKELQRDIPRAEAHHAKQKKEAAKEAGLAGALGGGALAASATKGDPVGGLGGAILGHMLEKHIKGGYRKEEKKKEGSAFTRELQEITSGKA